jgi:ATP-binding cassette subfamily B protein
MQQGLSQILNSLLTVLSVLVMMVWISWQLALISLIAIPLSIFASIRIAKRSQREFIAQWDWTGKLNGHVEEMHTCHSLVKVFGRRDQAIKDFAELNDNLRDSSFKAQFMSSIIMPTTTLISNLIYVGIAVLGGYRVATGSMSLGDVQAFIQYSRSFGMPLAQIAGLMNTVQSGVASAERLFELLDASEETPDATSPISKTSRLATCQNSHLLKISISLLNKVRPLQLLDQQVPAKQHWSTSSCVSMM